ncbi:MAG: Ig-like domain-containing protein [Halobacteriaceae archaeon]
MHGDDFLADDRAIEGLPIRLVVAFIVGVAALSVMLSMVSGVGGLAVTELDARPVPDVVTTGEQTIDVTAVDADGNPVAGATVVLRSDTAAIDGPVTARTNESGVATLTVSPSLPANRVDGTLSVSIKPPAGSQFVDDRENTAVLVLAG